MNDNSDDGDEEITTHDEVFRPGLTKDQVEFIHAFLIHGSLRKAEKYSRVSKSNHYMWIRKQLYAECFAAAKTKTFDAIDDEARRRAIDGVPEPVFDRNGKLCGHRRRYSDALLTRLWEAHAPEEYGRGAPGVEDDEVIHHQTIYYDARRGDPDTDDLPPAKFRVLIPENNRGMRIEEGVYLTDSKTTRHQKIRTEVIDLSRNKQPQEDVPE